MIDRRPALILRPTSVDEVVAALRFARDEDLAIAVRSGGHSLPGLSTCDDGVIIDLARMRGVTVDPERRIARCNGGALLGELDDAAQAVGLACTAGTVSHTGIAGLTLGGGMGRLQRKLGLAIDCLRAVELVTADGRHVRASADENPDLFWGMRGAGPNFGIVTALEFDLAPIGPHDRPRLPDLPGGARPRRRRRVPRVRADRARRRLRVGDHRPGRGIRRRPGGDGRRADRASLSLACVGPEAETRPGPGAAARARRAADRAASTPMAYLESQHANDEAMGWGHRIYTKSGFVTDLPDELVDALVDHVASRRRARTCSRSGRSAAPSAGCPRTRPPSPGRSAPFWIGAESMWDDPGADERAHRAWGRAGIDLTEPWRVTGSYVNDVTESGDEAVVRGVYGNAKYDRLVALKRAWDPDNVFRLNQNIRP